MEKEQLSNAKEALLRQKKELEEHLERLESTYRELKDVQKEYAISISLRDESRIRYGHLETLFLNAQAGILAQDLEEGIPVRYAVPVITRLLLSLQKRSRIRKN